MKKKLGFISVSFPKSQQIWFENQEGIGWDLTSTNNIQGSEYSESEIMQFIETFH
jgi:hypothetical protein